MARIAGGSRSGDGAGGWATPAPADCPHRRAQVEHPASTPSLLRGRRDRGGSAAVTRRARAAPAEVPGDRQARAQSLTIERVPKPGGGHRVLVRLGGSDGRRYAAAVLAAMPAVERALRPTVFANRAGYGRTRADDPRAVDGGASPVRASGPGGRRGRRAGVVRGRRRGLLRLDRSSGRRPGASVDGCRSGPRQAASRTCSAPSRTTACAGCRSGRPRRRCSRTPCWPPSTTPSLGLRGPRPCAGSTMWSSRWRASLGREPSRRRTSDPSGRSSLRPHPLKTEVARATTGPCRARGRAFPPRRARAWHDARAVRTVYRAARVHTQAHPRDGGVGPRRWAPRAACGRPESRRTPIAWSSCRGRRSSPDSSTRTCISRRPACRCPTPTSTSARSAEELLSVVRARAGAEGSGPLFLLGYDESRWRPDPGSLRRRARRGQRPPPGRAPRRRARGAREPSGAPGGPTCSVSPGVERDASGAPTGRLTSRANEAIGSWAMTALSDHERQALQLQAAGLAASRGVTSVHEMSMPHWSGDARPRGVPRPAGPAAGRCGADRGDDTSLADAIDRRARGDRRRHPGRRLDRRAHGVARGSVPHRLVRDRVPAPTTSSPSSSTAGTRRGCRSACTPSAIARSSRCSRSGSASTRRSTRGSAGTSERGDTASSISRWPRLRRWSARRCSASRSRCSRRSMRPGAAPAGSTSRRSARDRAVTMNPFRTMVERGVEVGVGSDAPITPLDPMLAIEALEHHHDPAQRLSRAEAIRLHTIGSARVGHQEEKKGALAPGHARRPRGLRRRPARRSPRSRGCVRSSPSRWGARSSPDDRTVLSLFLPGAG